jgi:Tfp pilus assembly protein PilW
VKRVRHSQEGMTLIEVLIGVLIVSLITGGIVSAMLTALNIFDPTSHRVLETNDSQTIAAFLTRDAQAAGGTDPNTGSLDTSHNLGVSKTDDAGCTTPGATLKLRFKWFDRTPTFASTGEQQVVVHVANYYFVPSTTSLVRTTCDSGAAPVPPSSATLGAPVQSQLAKTVQNVVASCDGASSCPSSFPDTVALTVTATNQAGPNNPPTAPYTYTVSASLRPEAETAPCDTTTGCSTPTGTVNPLIALGLCSGGGSDLDVGGSAQVDVNGGITGSSSCPPMKVHLSSGGSLQSGAITYTAGSVDPFAGLVPPLDACSTATSNPATTTVGGTVHYHPGTYHTDPTITGNVTVVFDPGNYVFCAGVSIAGSNTNVSGTDVLFYLKGGTASLNGGTVNVTGRQSQLPSDRDNYTGLLIWQAATDTTTPMQIVGGTSLNLNGIIYAPSIEVQLRGNSNTFFVKAIIAGAISFTGTTGITIGTPPPQMSITTPTSLPSWTVGIAYPNITAATTGGSGGNTWTVTGLPNGLSFNAATRTISGTPTVPGLFSPQIKVVDSDGDVAIVTFSLTISAAPTITGPANLPNSDLGRDYPPPLTTAIMTETGGTGPFTWSATGLPTGLAIDPASGAISGNPNVTGTFPTTITLTDNAGATATRTYPALTINALPAITAPSGSSLPAWTTGQSGYSQSITRTGGTGPYVWQLSGAPSGLTINNSGVISGTPTGPQDYTLVVTVTDAVGVATSKTYALTINPGLTITGSVPNGEITVPYTATLNANPGTPPYTWALTGALPPGLVLTPGPTTATISGTPTATGTYPVTLKLTDSTGATTNQTYSILINPPPSINATTLPSWTIGQNYGNSNTTMSGSGGLTPYTWSATGLPPGLSIGPNSGSITGSPTTTGTFSGTITLTDVAGITATRPFTVTINDVPSISTTTLPDGEITASYSAPMSASGGTPALRWTVSSGLPPGLGINPNTGVISGTPTATGTFPMTIHATDAAGADTAVTITINIFALGSNGLTLSDQSGGGSAMVGTRVYYRGSTAGRFTLTNIIATAGTAVSSNFAALGGTTSGFSFAPGTVSTPAGGPFVSSAFSWNNGTTSGPTETVTGRDSFGGATATTLTFVNDSGAPAPTIGAATPNPYTNSMNPTISGTASTQAADATHSADNASVSVAIYAGPTATGTPLQTMGAVAGTGTWSVTPAALTANAQYTVQVTQLDAVGNTGIVTKTFVVDTVAPTVTASMVNSGGGNNRITVSGTAGTQTADPSDSADAATVDVEICTAANYASHSNTCASGWAASSNATVSVTGGTYSVQSGNLSAGTYYATVTQTDAAGNTGTASAGPLTH